jgi:pilus assembly protein Flp/PilA
MLTTCKCLFTALRQDRRGVTALEYGVIAAAIVLAISAIVVTMGTKLSNTFTNISNAL